MYVPPCQQRATASCTTQDVFHPGMVPSSLRTNARAFCTTCSANRRATRAPSFRERSSAWKGMLRTSTAAIASGSAWYVNKKERESLE